MKVAIALEQSGNIYRGNPWTAPQFAIYDITPQTDIITFKKIKLVENPWIEEDESIICDPMMCSDGCSDIVKADLNHLADHYIILEAVHGCTYLLANTFCSNVEKVLLNGGIEIHQFPIFIKKPEHAIKNFIIAIFSPESSNKVTFEVKEIS